jgi:hypothetical protein
MSTGLAETPTMGKRRVDKPTMESVKIRSKVMDSARIVAAYTGEAMSDMLSDILEPILARREQEEAAKRAKDLRAKA